MRSRVNAVDSIFIGRAEIMRHPEKYVQDRDVDGGLKESRGKHLNTYLLNNIKIVRVLKNW